MFFLLFLFNNKSYVFIWLTRIIYNYLDKNDFKMCDFLNSGLKVKLKKLGRINKKALYIQHFLNKNQIIYLTQKTGLVHLLFSPKY